MRSVLKSISTVFAGVTFLAATGAPAAPHLSGAGRQVVEQGAVVRLALRGRDVRRRRRAEGEYCGLGFHPER